MKKLSLFNITILLVFHVYTHAGGTICKEPSDNINKFHLIWLGKEVSDKYLQNLATLCQHIKQNIKKDEKYKVLVWTDTNSMKIFADPTKCDTGETGNFDFEVNNISTLSDKVDDENKYIFNYYLEKQIYAGASDFLRLLAVLNNGGCYLDIGFEIQSGDFIAKDLIAKDDHDENSYYIYEPPMGSSDPEDRRIDAIAGRVIHSFNGFFAARKNHEILKRMLEEFSIKNAFFNKHRHIINFLFENCATGAVVMRLIGQWAYNDFYRSLERDKNPLYNNIKRLNLSKNLPYRGKGTWERNNMNDCSLALAALYDDFRNKNLKEDLANLNIDKDIAENKDNLRPLDWLTGFYGVTPINPMSESPNLVAASYLNSIENSISEVILRVIDELLKYYRRGMPHPAFDKLNKKYVNELYASIRGQKNIPLESRLDSEPCREELTKHVPHLMPAKSQHMDSYTYAIRLIVIKASLIDKLVKTKKLFIHYLPEYYDKNISTDFDLNYPDISYLGYIMPYCGMGVIGGLEGKGINFPVFIPMVKITPDLASRIMKREREKSCYQQLAESQQTTFTRKTLGYKVNMRMCCSKQGKLFDDDRDANQQFSNRCIGDPDE